MADIFISYASEDRVRAGMLAQALGARGWSIWWDREIPLGKTFDEVIEKALADCQCVVVLWSAVSIASEWVRNEASEAKRRGILIPVFIEAVEAPLAFRLLNGADLRDWRGDPEDGELRRLMERVAELLAQTTKSETGRQGRVESSPAYQAGQNNSPRTVLIAIGAVGIIGAAIAGYLWRGDQTPSRRPDPPISLPRTAEPELGNTDMEKRIRDLVGSLGTAMPATSLAKGFHVPDLGLRIAYLTPEQSASTLGAMPAGAVVMEVESGRPIAKAGIHVGDVVLSIGNRKIASEDDLRQAIFKIGPGKTDYSYRRGADIHTAGVDCPSCKAE
jgi:TIR domain-containing protein/PDZ domain-containing protein